MKNKAILLMIFIIIILIYIFNVNDNSITPKSIAVISKKSIDTKIDSFILPILDKNNGCEYSIYRAIHFSSSNNKKHLSPDKYLHREWENDVASNLKENDFINNTALKNLIRLSNQKGDWLPLLKEIEVGSFQGYGEYFGKKASLYDLLFFAGANNDTLNQLVAFGILPTEYSYEVLIETTKSNKKIFEDLNKLTPIKSEYKVYYRGRKVNFSTLSLLNNNRTAFLFFQEQGVVPELSKLTSYEKQTASNLLGKEIYLSKESGTDKELPTHTYNERKVKLVEKEFSHFQLIPVQMCNTERYKVLNTIPTKLFQKVVANSHTPLGMKLLEELIRIEPLHQDLLFHIRSPVLKKYKLPNLTTRLGWQVLAENLQNGQVPKNAMIRNKTLFEYALKNTHATNDILMLMIDQGMQYRLDRIMLLLFTETENYLDKLQSINFDMDQRQNGKNIAGYAANFGDIELVRTLLNLGLEINSTQGSDVLDVLLKRLNTYEDNSELFELIANENWDYKDSHAIRLNHIKLYEPDTYKALVKIYPFLKAITLDNQKRESLKSLASKINEI